MIEESTFWGYILLLAVAFFIVDSCVSVLV